MNFWYFRLLAPPWNSFLLFSQTQFGCFWFLLVVVKANSLGIPFQNSLFVFIQLTNLQFLTCFHFTSFLQRLEISTTSSLANRQIWTPSVHLFPHVPVYPHIDLVWDPASVIFPLHVISHSTCPPPATYHTQFPTTVCCLSNVFFFLNSCLACLLWKHLHHLISIL